MLWIEHYSAMIGLVKLIRSSDSGCFMRLAGQAAQPAHTVRSLRRSGGN